MEFNRLDLADIPRYRALLAADPREQSEYSVSYEFPFADAPHALTRLAETDGCGIWRWCEDEGQRFLFPVGPGDKRRALLALRDYCKGEGIPLVVCSMSETDLALFKSTLGEAFDISLFRPEADYVYRTKDLAELPGRAYLSRRTFVNHFTKAAPWSYEPITAANIGDCRRVLEDWATAKRTDGKPMDYSLVEETEATRIMLDNLPALGLGGGLLRQDGEPVAFALAERLTADTMLLAYEKALPHVHGAFQTGDREFARHCSDGCAFVNRAYDEGSEGLRAVKLLYHPVRMIEKYIARAR